MDKIACGQIVLMVDSITKQGVCCGEGQFLGWPTPTVFYERLGIA